eukprot:scaffold92042_cov53-Attheya_sp.AAC.1
MEKSAYDQMKEEHKSHSEALFAHEDMMPCFLHVIDSAQSMERVIRKEIQVDTESLNDGANTNDDVNNEEVAKVQAQVVSMSVKQLSMRQITSLCWQRGFFPESRKKFRPLTCIFCLHLFIR